MTSLALNNWAQICRNEEKYIEQTHFTYECVILPLKLEIIENILN